MNIIGIVWSCIILNLLNVVPLTSSNDLIIIPFEYNKFGHIILDVNINGGEEPLKFIFDTGAGAITNTGYDKFLPLCLSDISSLQVGNLVITKPKFTKINLCKKFGSDYMGTIAGLFGSGLMDGFVWQIDYHKRVIRISKSIKEMFLGKKCFKIPFKRSIYYKCPIVTLETNEVGNREYLIDTGSPGEIEDYKKVFLKALRQDIKIDYVLDTTTFIWSNPWKRSGLTTSYGRTARINNSRLGNMILRHANIRFSDVPILLIGNKFLENFIVTMDWPSSIIYLEPAIDCKLDVDILP